MLWTRPTGGARPVVKQLERYLVTLGKIAGEGDHRARLGQVGYPHNVAMAAMVQYRSLRATVIAAFHPLVEQPPQIVAYARALRRRRIVQLPFPPRHGVGLAVGR